MRRKAQLHLIDLPAVRRRFSVWRHSLSKNDGDRQRFERVFIRVFMERVLKLLGRRAECHFDEEITSGTRFQGLARVERDTV
jgi:hypothetical protein